MSVSDSLIADLIGVADSASTQLATQIEEFYEWAPIGLKTRQKDEDGKGRVIALDVGDDGDPNQVAARNRNVTAAQALQMQVQTQSTIRLIETMLALNRTIKEAHLFGGLQTLGGSKAEAETEKYAREVAEALPRLMNPEASGSGQSKT